MSSAILRVVGKTMMTFALLLATVLAVDSTSYAPPPAPQDLPKRAVPDTRSIAIIRWPSSAFDSLEALEARSIKSGMEEGMCLYGSLSPVEDMPGSVAIEILAVRTPAEVIRQDGISVNVSCYYNAYYVGMVHTHPRALRATDMVLDVFLLSGTEAGIVTVAINDGWLSWITREQISPAWNYREAMR